MLLLELQILGDSDRAFALQGGAHAYSRPLLFGWAILYAAICLVIYRSVEKRVKSGHKMIFLLTGGAAVTLCMRLYSLLCFAPR